MNRRPHDKPYGEVPLIDVGEIIRTRMQSPGFDDSPRDPTPTPSTPRTRQARQAIPPPADLEPLAPGDGPGGPATLGGASEVFAPPADEPLGPIDVPIAPLPPSEIPPGTGATPIAPIGEGEPPGTFPSLPGGNMTDVGPDRQEPFPNRSYADIVTQVEEAPTGRFQLAVGATSYGGLNGSIILTRRISTCWRSLDRGGNSSAASRFEEEGRTFASSCLPARRSTAPWSAIVTLICSDLPGGRAIGFGVSGYAFSRIYQGQFNENRGGGRFSLGTQLGTSTYLDVAARVEDVRISNFNYPAPAAFLAASGHTFLSTLRPSLRFDNRNDPFAPNKGQYLEMAFEQGWGDFTYPKFTAEGRTYFTTGSRPDGTGKRIITARGFSGSAVATRRFTNGSTRETSAACEASRIEASVPANWERTSAAS